MLQGIWEIIFVLFTNKGCFILSHLLSISCTSISHASHAQLRQLGVQSTYHTHTHTHPPHTNILHTHHTHTHTTHTHTPHTHTHTQSFDGDSSEYSAEVLRRRSAQDALLGLFQINKDSDFISVKINADSGYTRKNCIHCTLVIYTRKNCTL